MKEKIIPTTTRTTTRGRLTSSWLSDGRQKKFLIKKTGIRQAFARARFFCIHQEMETSLHRKIFDGDRGELTIINGVFLCVFSVKDKFNYIGLSHNNLRVQYKGNGKTHKEASSVRATAAIPASCGIYYFEVGFNPLPPYSNDRM